MNRHLIVLCVCLQLQCVGDEDGKDEIPVEDLVAEYCAYIFECGADAHVSSEEGCREACLEEFRVDVSGCVAAQRRYKECQMALSCEELRQFVLGGNFCEEEHIDAVETCEF